MTDDPGRGPVAGVRVLDLTSAVMGPLATQTLGDLGAEVVTIERAGGELNRRMGRGPHGELSGVSLNLLRNKRNVALDLKHPAGRQALLRIAATCDVFLTNLLPAPLDRLGLGYAEITRVRPDVIYCHAQGFPADGERANEPAYDDIIQAAAGVPDVVRRAVGTPSVMPTLLADKVCGLVVTYAVLAALFHRERTGEGQRIEVPMVDALTAFMLVEHGAAAISGDPPRNPSGGRDDDSAGFRRILTAPRCPLRTADGWLAVFPYTVTHWAELLRAAGSADLLAGVRRSLADRDAEPSFAYAVLAKALTTKPTAEWLRLCAAHRIPATEVADLDALVEALPEEDHPVAGRYKSIPAPVRFGRTPAAVRRPAPLVGQHNREVLAEAGMSEEEINRLEANGVLR